ncbi:MAG: Hsp20/alpha crystallin family protein [Bdellovibrionales bacterium]|nr:Hsp20/alpha crystallin family protein [Bdellovibrionales bacterium]
MNLNPNNLDQTIEHVERLYTRITGQEIPPVTQSSSPFTPEVDPLVLVDSRIQQLIIALQDPMIQMRLRPWNPPISVWDSEEKIVVRLDIPGVQKENIDIHVRGNLLTISGTRSNSKLEPGYQPRVLEIPFGAFHRTIALPLEVTPSELDSRVENGVLEVQVVKRASVPASHKKNNKSAN